MVQLSCPSSQGCHSTISSSVVPFSCPQSSPASGSFPMSQFFTSGGQSIGASASVPPMNIQDWFPLRLTVWSPCSRRDFQVFCNTIVPKHLFFGAQPSLWSNSHIHTREVEIWIALAIQTFVGKVMSLLFNTLSRFAIGFLPSSKHLNFGATISVYSDFGAQ